MVTGNGLTTSVLPLWHGTASTGVTVHNRVNPLGPTSRTPWASTADPVVPGAIYPALIVLSGVPVPTDVRLTIDDRRVEVTWPDGTQSRTSLPA